MLLVRGRSFHFLKNLTYLLFGLFNIFLFLLSYLKCQEIGGPADAFALEQIYIWNTKNSRKVKENLHRLSGWCISLFAPILIFPNDAINKIITKSFWLIGNLLPYPFCPIYLPQFSLAWWKTSKIYP